MNRNMLEFVVLEEYAAIRRLLNVEVTVRHKPVIASKARHPVSPVTEVEVPEVKV